MIDPVETPRFVRNLRGGFSFVEILFAVMILGIGFILIAGIFPVAINQTQANGDETAAASIARRGAATIANLPGTATGPAAMVANNAVHRFGPSASASDTALWQLVCGNLILPEDPRFAWIPFYLRAKDAAGSAADSAQIIIIGVRARSRDSFDPSLTGPDLQFTGAGINAVSGLMGESINVQLTSANSGYNYSGAPDQIKFVNGPGMPAVTPGAYVIISSDNSAAGSAAGWILKVGDLISGSTYQLQPGGDMKSSPTYRPAAGTTLSAFIVGKGVDPANPAKFIGDSQAVMAYSTFVRLN